MKAHIIQYCFLYIFLVQGACLHGNYEEYSHENIKILNQWAYVIGRVATTSFLMCELIKKNRIQRLYAYLKTVNACPIKKFFGAGASMGEMIVWGIAHQMLRAF